MYVYILKLDNRFYYTGMTNDIKRRLKEHSKSKKGFTAKFKEKKIIFLYILDNRLSARKLEIHIKKTGAKRFLLMNSERLRKDEKLGLLVGI